MKLKFVYLAAAACFSLAACDPNAINIVNSYDDPTRTETTRIGGSLALLPGPQRKVDIAVYAYDDQTGQQKPEDNFSRFSKAVTQGGQAILLDVLKDVLARGIWVSACRRNTAKTA